MRQKSGYRKKRIDADVGISEIALGQADPSIVAEYGLYDNPVLQNFITTKGKEMAAIFLIEISCPFSLKLLIHLWSMPLHCREGMSISQEA